MFELLKMNYFAYQRITNDNKYFCIASCPDYLEFYIKHACYEYDPYLCDPNKYAYGQSIMPIITMNNIEPESDWDVLLNSCRNDFNIYHWLLIVNRTYDYYELCCLGLGVDNLKELQNFLSNTQVVNRFISYFKKRIITPSNLDNITSDLKLIKKSHHIQTDNNSSLQINEKMLLQFIKDFDPSAQILQDGIKLLTIREYDCLVWLTKGKTAIETAELLNISVRTVEKHRENIKQKLGGYSNITYLAHILGKYNIML